MKERDKNGTFAKGNPGGGRPKLAPEILEIINASKPAVITAYWKVANLTEEDSANYKPVTLLEAGIFKTMSEYAKTGETKDVVRLWDQVHGKPKETIDLDANLTAGIIYLDKQDESL